MILKSVFGLTILSSFDLPELADARHVSETDLEITTEDLSALRAATPVGGPVWIRSNLVHFHLENGMLARVSCGNKIELDIPSDIPFNIARAYLLGSVMTLALLQRNLLVFHANVINIDGQAVLCAGASGVGKSTTAATFEKMGFPCYADDLAVVDPDVGVFPGIPRIKLLPDAVERLNMYNNLSQNQEKIAGKFHFPIEVTGTSLPLRALFLLKRSDKVPSNFECTKLTGARLLSELLHYRFRRRFASTPALRMAQMQLATRLAKTVDVYQIHRSREGATAQMIADHIVELVQPNKV